MISQQDLSDEGRNSRRLVAIMLTDLVGYTRMAQKDEQSALSLLERHRGILRPLFRSYKGREVKTMGDAFLVEFESAVDATLCAIQIQRALGDQNLSRPPDEGMRIELRIGIHVGEILRDGGDILGDAVNVVSRIEPLSEPGGVCVSQQVVDQVRNKIEHSFSKLPPMPLKNILFKTELYSVDLPWRSQKSRTKREEGVRIEKGERLDRRRLAVLPFANMISDPDDEYFADGMTEELISNISKIRELSVISRRSIMRYKATTKSAPEIGEELDAGTLIEGSVRKAGNRVRISVQIIDAADDKHLWAENFDRTLDDVFLIQSEIAERAASVLKIKLFEEERKDIAKESTSSPEAHTVYLQGRYYYHKMTRDSIEKASAFFERAVELDPAFALACAQLANCYSLLGFFEMLPAADVFPKAKLYASKAVEIDSSEAECHIAVGLVMFVHDWNFGRAEREYRRAIELSSSSVSAHLQLSNLLENTGRFAEAIDEANRALELDPVSPPTLQHAGTMYLYARRYDEATLLFKRALELEPDQAMAHDNLGLCLVFNDLVEEGTKEILEAIELSKGSNQAFVSDLAIAYVRSGRKELVPPLLKGAIELYDNNSGSATTIAMLYSILGEKDLAFQWLERAYNERAGYLTSSLVEFSFDGIRSDPRFTDSMKRIGLVPV